MDNIFNEERFEKGGVVLERLHPELAVKPFIPYYEKMGYTVTIIEKPNGWVEIIGEKKFEEGGEVQKSKLQEMFEVQQRGSMREKAEFLKNNPEIFMGKVFEEGGEVSDEVAYITKDGRGVTEDMLYAKDKNGRIIYLSDEDLKSTKYPIVSSEMIANASRSSFTFDPFQEGGITEVNEDGSNLPQELYILFAEMDLDREGSYDYMEELRVEANEMGYDFDYDLSGTLTQFWKLDDKYDKGGEITKEKTREIAKEYISVLKESIPIGYRRKFPKRNKFTINENTLEEGSFDLDLDGVEYDGGSYFIKGDEVILASSTPQITVYNWKDKFAKGGRTKIVNEGVVFDSKKYKGILGDRDKDGVPNADDSEPNNPKIKKQVEQVKISKVFENLLDEKDSSDLNMNNLVNEMEITLPNKYGIYARTKTPFSIIKKLVEKRLRGKKGLTDMIGTTITVNNNDELQEVSRMLGGSEGANGKFGLVLDYDDFFSNPNCGYQAYHYIVNYNGEPIEIQLKTKRMKQLNEISHEFYKEGNLDCDGMEKMANLVNDADNGNKEAQKEFSYLMNNINELANIISTGSKEMGGRTDWINTINNSKESANIYRFD